jgi:FlaA1/EpsC-like NDP-sugar epimerase
LVIAIGDPSGHLVNRVLNICEGKDIRVRRVSGLALIRGDTAPLRPIGIEELLAREPVDLKTAGTTEQYGNKRIVLTGAAGSIGSELARQLTHLSPSHLFLLDTNESGLHSVHQSLGSSAPAEIVLGDIRDRQWLRHTFDQLRPDVVFHAAAYKHVPILEKAPFPAIATNVIGTANVLDAAGALGVGRFVFVSTDKAVEPASILGYTKRFGELLTIAKARELGRDYAVVRFGNVLGSAGSAVPIFTRQIDAGGPVTVTHPEATRYFMTIAEAAGLLIVAGALATPGDVLVLDMGKPVSIVELAKRMIKLRGLRTPTDIEILFTGLRPGEKLHEQLLSQDERATGTAHPRISRVEAVDSVATLDALDSAVRAIDDRLSHQDAAGALDILVSVLAVRHRTAVARASAT